MRVPPSGDTTVRSDRPNETGARSRLLLVRAHHPRRRAYLRFRVSVPTATHVTGATLVLHARTPARGATVALRRVRARGWRASRLDWRHAPRPGRRVDRARGFARGDRVAFDATSLVHGGRVAMALTAADGHRAVAFASREARRGRPRLLVSTAPDAVPRPSPRPSPVPPPGTGPGPGPAPGPRPYAWRGMYDRESGGGFSHIAAGGFNLIDSGPGNVDELTGGLKGLTWVGDYDNSTCSWQVPDSTITSEVEAHRGDPHIGVWFISDEPDPHACPDAYAQHRARSALIHAADPNARTLIVVDSNSGRQTLDQMAGWEGAADVFGLDPYPCRQDGPCHYDWIDAVVASADAAELPYWGVVQAFGDPPGGSWRLPTPDEIHEQFVHWRASAMTGYLVFAWRWPDGYSSLWLANHPELQAALRAENGT
jgi:hypothetical protein